MPYVMYDENNKITMSSQSAFPGMTFIEDEVVYGDDGQLAIKGTEYRFPAEVVRVRDLQNQMIALEQEQTLRRVRGFLLGVPADVEAIHAIELRIADLRSQMPVQDEAEVTNLGEAA